MKNKTKKILCMLVVVCILATMFVGLSVSVQAATSVSVSTFTQLEAALNDQDVDIIIINNDIVLEYPLYIDHDIKLIANKSREILASEGGSPHFHITKSINISFNNVILKGGYDYGGGIWLDSENRGEIIDVTIENPNIQNCHLDIGGAVSCRTETNLTVLGGILKNNSAAYGGALYTSYDDGTTTDLYGVVIEGNSAGIGGGICVNGGTLNMYSCILENNYNAQTGGDEGGGVYIEADAVVNIYDSEFSNNTSIHTGGAINNRGDLFVQNTTFEGNTSKDDGGCIYNEIKYNGDPYTSINDCTFIDNTSQNGKGGAIFIPEGSSGYIEDCIFTGNTSKLDGGAIYSNGGTQLYECTISNNTSLEGHGGAISFSEIPGGYWGQLYLNTCNINNNTSKLDGGAIYYDFEYNPNSFLVSNTTFSNNFSEAGGYYMYLPADIIAYDSVTWEITVSAPFYYAFNNYDISYTNGIPVPV